LTQPYNAQLIDQLATDFPRRLDASYAWGQAIGGVQLLPGLRAIWPYSSIDEHNHVLDLSGQGRVLYPGTMPNVSYYGISPCLDFVSASSMYLRRATEPGIEFTGAMTVWTWVYYDAPSTGSFTSLISKWGDAGDRSYLLNKYDTNHFYFSVSDDGTASVDANDTAAVDYYAVSKWYFLCGKYTPSIEVALFVGKALEGTYAWYWNVAAPAAIFNSITDLYVGADVSMFANYLDGRLGLSGLAIGALPDVYVWNIFSQTRPLFM